MAIARGVPGGGRVSLPPLDLPPAPDLKLPVELEDTEEDLEILNVQVEVNPQQVLDMYAEAQRRAHRVRKRIAEVSAELAQLRARHWGNGQNPSMYDQERRMLLDSMAQKERERRLLSLKEGGKPPSDAELEKWAHAQETYQRFIVAGRSEKMDMERLQARKEDLEGQLATALGAVAYYDKAHSSINLVLKFATANRYNGV